MTSVWIGCGDPPVPGAADHVVWVDGDDPAAAYDGRLTQRYHLLWELTHVCFEHPGLLGGDDGGRDEVCITCSDEGASPRSSTRVCPTPSCVIRAERQRSTRFVRGSVAPGDLVLFSMGDHDGSSMRADGGG